MYLPLIEVSLDWCYNKIASRFKVTWNKCHIISSKLALPQQFYQLTTAFTKGRGLATATEMWLQKWFCVVSIFIANNVLWSNVGELSWSWILKNNISRFRKRRKFRHGIFMSLLCSDGKEMYKKVCCTCNVFFWFIEPIDVVMFFSPSPSSNLKTLCISLVNRLWMPLMSFLRFWMPGIQWDVDVHRCLTLEFSLIIFHCNFFKCWI